MCKQMIPREIIATQLSLQTPFYQGYKNTSSTLLRNDHLITRGYVKAFSLWGKAGDGDTHSRLL